MLTEDLRNMRTNLRLHAKQSNVCREIYILSRCPTEITRIAENNCVLLKMLVIIFYSENILSLW